MAGQAGVPGRFFKYELFATDQFWLMLAPMIRRIRLLLSIALMVLAGPLWSSTVSFLDIGNGNIPVVVPDDYDSEVAVPLIVMLHGYGSSGNEVEGFLGFTELTDTYGFIYSYPDGAVDKTGELYWNASDACCDFDDSGVDHVAYLLKLVNELGKLYTIDPQRIYFLGHSNGGFMSYRMACEHADIIAAVASLAGVTSTNEEQCSPSEPVHILHIHGTADQTINYGGGTIEGTAYPGAVTTVERWANYNGCSDQSEQLPARDLIDSLAGNETKVMRYSDGCDKVGSVELWTIENGTHAPLFNEEFNEIAVEWLSDHAKAKNQNVALNAGFNDAWRNAVKKGGQGVFIVVFPTLKFIFMSWFTYDMFAPADDIDYTIGHPSQRWYTAFGPYEGDTAVLDLELTKGGIFDTATVPEQSIAGTVTLTSIHCKMLRMEYEIFDADVSGEIDLSRIVDDNVPYCESLAEDAE